MASRPWILGLSYSHNGAACLLHGDELVVAIQEERLTRVKYDVTTGARPMLAIVYCLEAAGIAVSDLAGIAYSVQGHARAPLHDLTQNPQLRAAHGAIPIRHVGHHRAHALSALHCSGFESAAVLVVDGVGSPACDLPADEQAAFLHPGGDRWESLSLYEISARGTQTIAKDGVAGGRALLDRGAGRMAGFASLGGMYSAVAQYVFDDALDGGKIMGLAPYGQPRFSPASFLALEETGMRFHDEVPAQFVGAKEREPLADLAASVQLALEQTVLAWCRRLRGATGARALCYAGGVALNGVANERIVRESGFERCFFMPAADDSGTAIGAAVALLRELEAPAQPARRLRSDELGRRYTSAHVEAAISASACAQALASEDWVGSVVETLIAEQVVGLFVGGSEFGPRSLGQRSILCDARDPHAKDRLNERVKHREPFRPFAPAVLEEHAAGWFCFDDTQASSPFMLRVLPVKPEVRDLVPGIVHLDGTARVQTVGPERGALRAVLERFYAKTGVPMLINTSFNVMGEPIVETPADAIDCLLETDIDLCVLDGRLVRRHASIATMLEMYPVSTLRELSVVHPQEGVTGSQIAFTVHTPYGSIRRTASLSFARLLARCDGTRSGLAILAELVQSGQEITAGGLERLLSQLRRMGAIRYEKDDTAAKAALLAPTGHHAP